MSTRTKISLEEYLHTSFEDGPDREYVDGELVERAMPTFEHGLLQGRWLEIFSAYRKSHSLWAVPEVRNRLSPTRYRIPDVAVYDHRVKDDYPSTPPVAAIEIVSPDDRISEIMKKLGEYSAWGIRHIWLIDPRKRLFYVFTDRGLAEVEALEAPELGITLHPADILPA